MKTLAAILDAARATQVPGGVFHAAEDVPTLLAWFDAFVAWGEEGGLTSLQARELLAAWDAMGVPTRLKLPAASLARHERAHERLRLHAIRSARIQTPSAVSPSPLPSAPAPEPEPEPEPAETNPAQVLLEAQLEAEDHEADPFDCLVTLAGQLGHAHGIHGYLCFSWADVDEASGLCAPLGALSSDSPSRGTGLLSRNALLLGSTRWRHAQRSIERPSGRGVSLVVTLHAFSPPNEDVLETALRSTQDSLAKFVSRTQGN